MPSQFRTPKTLSQWLDVNYFRRRRRFRRVSLYVFAGTFVLAALAVAATLVTGHNAYQADELCAVHAMYNNDCQKCHTESFQTWQRFWTHDPSIRSVSEEACSKCHAGLPHHKQVLAHDAPATHCVFCHREHRGERQLTHVPDDFCQGCHRDLKGALKCKPRFQNVANWRDHPDFMRRWLTATDDKQQAAPTDPGTIRFNHAVHLRAEGVPVLDEKQLEQQSDKEAAAERVRHVSRKVLKCADCHVPDSAGRYMKPITFEQHCKECHPLSVQVPVLTEDPKKKATLREFAKHSLPHAEPDVVRGALRSRLADFISGNPEFLDSSTGVPRPIPGNRSLSGEAQANREEFAWVNKHQKLLEDRVFTQAGWCQRCHESAGQAELAAGKRFRKSNINTRQFAGRDSMFESQQWFPHSRFNHHSHRMCDCTSCHAGIKDSKLTSTVHMPGIAKCRECHGADSGSARTDCFECHNYHPASAGTHAHTLLK